MRANNWGKCPACCAEETTRAKQLRDAYGTVPVEEYHEMETAMRAHALKTYAELYSLREDYEVRTDEHGVFAVSYKCACTQCGFSFYFDHTEEVL